MNNAARQLKYTGLGETRQRLARIKNKIKRGSRKEVLLEEIAGTGKTLEKEKAETMLAVERGKTMFWGRAIEVSVSRDQKFEVKPIYEMEKKPGMLEKTGKAVFAWFASSVVTISVALAVGNFRKEDMNAILYGIPVLTALLCAVIWTDERLNPAEKKYAAEEFAKKICDAEKSMESAFARIEHGSR